MMVDEEMTIPAKYRNVGDTPTFSDTIFGFLDMNYPSSRNSSEDMEWGDEDDDEDDEAVSIEKKAYWDEQEKLLNGTLSRTSSIESRVRNATREGLKQKEGNTKCLRQLIFHHLSNLGFTCFIQTSKWKNCRDIPSGEHTYLEVVEKSSPNKEEARVIIELNFKAEFEMGRASHEYNHLIRKLPQVYVAKPERLMSMIKILCGAAKKCMKDKKMHLAPWRKLKYMQAKWLINPCTTEPMFRTTTTTITTTATPTTTTSPLVAAKYLEGMVKPRSSMLTRSLIEKSLSRSRCQIIKVL